VELAHHVLERTAVAKTYFSRRRLYHLDEETRVTDALLSVAENKPKLIIERLRDI
jgi:hypothetical protein